MIETGKGKVTFLKLGLRKVGRHSGEDSKQLLALEFFFLRQSHIVKTGLKLYVAKDIHELLIFLPVPPEC